MRQAPLLMDVTAEFTGGRPAIAAFKATQVAFVALVNKGILSTTEAEAILRNAIEVIKNEATGEQAAELLSGILERLSKVQAVLGNRPRCRAA
jgi:hypothetical protein